MILSTETNDSVLNTLDLNLDQVTSLRKDDIAFLKRIFKSKQINALFKIYNKVERKAIHKQHTPILSTSVNVIIDVLDVLAQFLHHSGPDVNELFMLLQKAHIQGLLCAHDAVAQKDYVPHLPETVIDADDDESFKIVQLVKSNEPMISYNTDSIEIYSLINNYKIFLLLPTSPLKKGEDTNAEPIVGATIKNDEISGKIVFARIMTGGVADRSGLINIGDEIIEVNNINVTEKTPNDILNILKNSEATITFKLIPAEQKHRSRESKIRVRAFFDYCADNDSYIPCKEAGLDFQRGDILHILSHDDPYWWQARRENDPSMYTGLIPSRALQEKRIIHERNQRENSDEIKCLQSSSPILSCSMGNEKCLTNGPKVKKIMYDLSENEDFDREEIATYEEVGKLFPRQGYYRPIVLIGAPGVGRNELKRRLVAKNPNKYTSPIPYTSRPMKPGEIDGQDYVFVTREDIEEDISEGKFIEYGEYRSNLYGTSIESIYSIMNSGQVCVICSHYQALKMIRAPTLKPFVIFIKAPELDVLRETRTSLQARSTFDIYSSRGFTDGEFETIVKSSKRIEYLYNHWFDSIIVNDDLVRALDQLNTVVETLEQESSWVPVSWVQ